MEIIYLGFIKRLKNEDITLETSSNNLIIKQGKSIFKLPSYDQMNIQL